MRLLAKEDFNALPDAANGVGDRLYKAAMSENSVAAVIEAAATKRYAVSRIRRMTMCAALGIADGMANAPEKADIGKCIAEASARHGVPESLIRALIWRESKFNPRTVGKAGEIGLMQIMPGAVADWCSATGNPAPSKKALFHPGNNIEIGTWYLAQAGRHWKDYRSREILQLSEYNAGYGNVSKNMKPKSPDDELKLSDITIPSTRKYVEDILAKKAEYEKGASGK